MRWIFLSLFLIAASINSSFAQCDSSLEPSDNSVLRYRSRGNRCEGFFRRNVSSAGLELVSCTIGDFRFKNEKGEIITLQVPSSGQKPAYVRAQSILSGVYYRMDAELKSGQSLEWTADDVLLKRQETSRASNIGLLAFRGDGVARIFFPVEARSKLLSTQQANAQIVVRLLSAARPASLRWQLNGGAWQEETGPFFAGRPFRILLPAGLKAGKHTLEIRFRGLNEPDEIPLRFVIQI